MAGPVPSSWAVDPMLAAARELAPGLWRLRLPWCWEGVDHVNAYLLCGADERVLVDCGPGGHPSCLAALEHALDQAGVRIESITGLVLTHAHSDHVGQGHAVVARSGAEVWRHADNDHVDAVLADPEQVSARRLRRARAEGVPAAQTHWFADVREEVEAIVSPLAADHTLREGSMVPTPLGPLTVVHTPGHAPSQVALVQRERGIAILGDSLCAVFSPYCDYGYSNDPVGQLLESLDRIDALGDLALALPGHGGPLRDRAAVLAAHRTGVARGLGAVRAAIDQGPAGAYELARRAFGPATTPMETFGRTNLTACYLRHLRVRGDVRRRVAADGSLRYQPGREPATAPDLALS